MKRKRLLASFVCGLLVLWAMAQTPVSFTSDQGLSNTCIRSIVQDSRKNVWICTQNGLNRYDGAKMNIYLHDDDDETSLGDDNVTYVLEEKPGRILVGTECGVQYYSYDTDRFTLVPLVSRSGDTLQAHVVSMARLADGTIYVCTSGYGCYRLHTAADGEAELLQTDDLPTKGHLLHMMEDSRGRLWVFDAGDNVYCRENGRLTLVGHYSNASRFCESSSGRIYLATVHNGLLCFSESEGEFVPADRESRRYVIAAVTAAANGQLLVSTDGNGLKIYDEATGRMEQSNIRTYEYNLATSNVKDAIMDADGNIWVGVYWKGVLVMPDVVTDFEYVGRRSVQKNTIGTNCVTAITGDGQGDLWVATDHCGVYHLKHDGTSSVHFKPGEVKGMPSTVMRIFEDSRGTLWLGSSWNGVVKMDKRTGECVPLGKIVPGGDNIPNAYALAEDGEGNIWIGTMGFGLFRYRPHDGSLVRYQTLENNTLSYPYKILHNGYVRSLLVVGDVLYAGTPDGIGVFTLERGELKFKEKYLAQHSIRDMKPASDGTLWVATTLGLAHIEPAGGNCRVFDRKQGLPNNAVSSVELTRDGKVWVGTNDGIACFDPATETFDCYDVIDGLQGNEFTEHASYALDGILYFGGINGLTYFHPSDVGKHKEAEKIDLRVVDFYVNGRAVHVGDRSGRYYITDRWISLADRVNLSYKDKSFSVELSTMNFFIPRVTYYYKINNGAWTALENRQNYISFVNMEAGTYHIGIKAEAYGETSEVKNLTVVVHPVWYLSLLAFMVYAVLFLFVCYVVVQQVKERIKARQILAEHRQTKELNEARIQFFMNISHEIRTPMTLILSPLEKLMKMDTDEAHQRNYMLIYQNSQRILRLINQLMDARKIEKGQFRLKYHKVEMVGFINNLYDLFRSTAASRGITFTFVHAMPELTVCIDPQNFDKVVMNLLSNAFKFTPDGGAVEIELRDVPSRRVPDERYFVLTVTDTGVGIPDKDKARVFERFYAGDRGNGYVGTGIGLNLTKLLVQLHEGSIRVEDNPAGQGTRFSVRMPQALKLMENFTEESLAEATYTFRPEKEHLIDSVLTPEDLKDAGNRKHQLLIVEDDAAIRRYLHSELAGAYYVHECSNGKEALDYIMRHTERIDLVVSDVMMPVMDGITLLQKVKENFVTSHIPVVLLTARSEDADRLAGLSGGADAYLSKPFNIDILRHTIENLLKTRRMLEGKFQVKKHSENHVEELDVVSPDDNLMERITKVVSDNLSNPDLNVELIAEKVGISRVHFHRRLKDITGLTPRDFVRNYRLMRAAKLFSEKKDYDITDVSIAVGFKSVSTFSTSFKAYYGMTPTEYMKLKASEAEEKK